MGEGLHGPNVPAGSGSWRGGRPWRAGRCRCRVLLDGAVQVGQIFERVGRSTARLAWAARPVGLVEVFDVFDEVLSGVSEPVGSVGVGVAVCRCAEHRRGPLFG